MHIGYITSHFPFSDAKSVGGIGTSIKNLGLELVRSGHKVSVFVYGQDNDEVLVDNGIQIYKIKHPKFRFLSWWFTRKSIQKKINLFVKQTNIDILEAPDWTGITAFMNLVVPLVIRFHGSDAYFCRLENRKQKPKNFFFERTAITNASGYIAPTNFAGQLTASIFDLNTKVFKTIPNGLFLDRFNNEAPDVFEHGLIVYVGAIIRKKGVLELPAIFDHVINIIPEARLLLLGSDAYDITTGSESTWQLLQQQLDEKTASKVTFLGNTPYDVVQDYMKKAHVCVFPTFAETLGMVTIESMALQKPVVTSNFGWSQELIVDGESGFLCHPKDHKEFADKIIALMTDKELAGSIGKAARKRVELKFNIKETAKDNVAFYSEIINNKNART